MNYEEVTGWGKGSTCGLIRTLPWWGLLQNLLPTPSVFLPWLQLVASVRGWDGRQPLPKLLARG